MSEFELAGRRCKFEQYGIGGPVVFIGGLSEYTAAVIEMVRNTMKQKPVAILIFDLPDWMNECAPWDGRVAENRIIGKAGETLNWLIQEAIPYVKRSYQPTEMLIAGYSMTGLLALWSLYYTDIFAGAACCSGSLWYPGWVEFAERNNVRAKNAAVYLSLGGKEANTAVSHMQSIEKNTRRQLELLKKDPEIRTAVLEMNPGGHFTKVTERQAKGIAWLLQNRTE